MSTQTTFAPSRAKATAVAFPLPQPGPLEPAPSTIATLPIRRSGIALPLDAFPLLSAVSATVPARIHRAQFGLQNLAVIVLRQRIDEHIVFRTFEARDRRQAERIELLCRGVADHIGDDHLAPFRIGSADHRN